MISVYVLRHGRAESSAAKADADRELTAAGQAIMEAVGRALAARGIRFHIVLSSPLRRAVQTAGAICDALGAGEPHIDERLASGASPDTMLEVIQSALAKRPRQDASVLVVGHMPDVARFTAAMTAAADPISFSPGMLARIDFEAEVRERAGVLTWAHGAEQLADG